MKATFRLTVKKPNGQIGYDNLVTADLKDHVTCTLTEDITSDAIDVIMGKKAKKKVLKRTFVITIRRLNE